MKPLTNETLIEEWEKKFDKLTSEYFSFESGYTWKQKEAAIKAFILSALQAKQDDMVEKIDYMLETLEPKFKTNIALYNNGFDDALHEAQIKLSTL